MERLWSRLAPRGQTSELAGVAVDAARPRRELVLENAVLHHQVNILRRRSKRPRLHLIDRLKLLIGARWLPSWRPAIVLVQPGTVLRWHRAGFRQFWRRRSRSQKTSPLAPKTIDLIRDMAAQGRLWGAERIRGELLKLGIKVSKRTVQKYMRGVRGRNGGGQRWGTFVRNHAERMWVCDFIQTHDLLFRQVHAFFIVHLASRRVVHVAATRHPTQAWTAQQLRNATMDGDAPAVLLRDRDDKFGPAFDRAAQGVGAKVIAISEFVEHYHRERNHQGLDNRLITPIIVPANDNANPAALIERRERLGGLLSYYYRAAA
jgi:hypothetical protein